MSLRQNTGYEDNMYGMVAGHADGNETVREALVREAKEESGITIDPQALTLLHTMHRRTNRENIDLFFTTDSWEGEIANTEPHKCGELAFYPLSQLPPNTLPYLKRVLQYIEQGIPYSEHGW